MDSINVNNNTILPQRANAVECDELMQCKEHTVPELQCDAKQVKVVNCKQKSSNTKKRWNIKPLTYLN